MDDFVDEGSFFDLALPYQSHDEVASHAPVLAEHLS